MSDSATKIPGPSKGGVDNQDFIRTIVADELKSGVITRVVTRFPPEPNGYLHIGHAKSICLNFGVAARVRRHVQPALRRHQSRPRKTSSTSRRSRKTSVGSGSNGQACYFASDYFEQLYECADASDQTGHGVRGQL